MLISNLPIIRPEWYILRLFTFVANVTYLNFYVVMGNSLNTYSSKQPLTNVDYG